MENEPSTVASTATASDRHLCAHSYERDRKDLFIVQSEVAATIADLIGSITQKPDSAERAIFIIGFAYEQKGMYKNAIAEYKKRLPNEGSHE